jgi:chitosanase
MFTEQQRTTIQSIIQIFETGGLSKKGYGIITNLRDDRGGLTYGKHQASLNSGSLFGMLKGYSENPQAQYGRAFLPYLQRLANADASLSTDQAFMQLLRNAGIDPIMAYEQDKFFAQRYFQPAEAWLASRGYVHALTLAIVYDSFIHGSFKRINANIPLGSENMWAYNYVNARRNWLANSRNPLLRNCVYRPDTFSSMIKANRWDLELPLTIRGVTIRAGLDTVAPVPNPSVLFNNVSAQPLLRQGMRDPAPGGDVSYLQDLLNKNGYPIHIDGDYGQRTFMAVTAFQGSHGLTADGIVGPRTWDVLDDILPRHA